jgi:predicted nucleotidyltransferase
MDKIIYTFWTGDNEMSKNRKDCIQQLKNFTGCKVELITKKTLDSYILDYAPLTVEL